MLCDIPAGGPAVAGAAGGWALGFQPSATPASAGWGSGAPPPPRGCPGAGLPSCARSHGSICLLSAAFFFLAPPGCLSSLSRFYRSVIDTDYHFCIFLLLVSTGL